MQVQKWRTGSVALALLIALGGGQSGCKDPHRVDLQSRLDSLNNQSSSTSQQISDQQSSLVALQQRLSSERTALNDYNAGVQNYMLQHKLAVAAIVAGVAGTVPWIDDNNKYSQDAKEIGIAMTAIALIWASQNMDEVSEVLGNLTEADAHRKSAQTEIDQTSAAIQQQQASLQGLQNQMSHLSQEINSVKGELSRL
jgi:predicted  nucleic acid-binding Zn-ribbon protein